MQVNLVIIQPRGDVHPLGFLDPARYIRYQLRRLGVSVTISKNRFRYDCPNLVFGAHASKTAALVSEFPCVICNFEQIGEGGPALPESYLETLRSGPSLDYDIANVRAYRTRAPASVPIIKFLNAPYLNRPGVIDLRSKPVDLLFIGAMNERRRQFVKRIMALGLSVQILKKPLYSEERNELVSTAKAVLNFGFYETVRFEQIRAFTALSLGAALISERRPGMEVDEAYQDAVFWVDDSNFDEFFARYFKSDAWYQDAHSKLEYWRKTDSQDSYAGLPAFAKDRYNEWVSIKPRSKWRPLQMNLGAGGDYRIGWLNVDIQESAEPDLLADLSAPLVGAFEGVTRFGRPFDLRPGSLKTIYASNVLEHVPDLVQMMTNLLYLLEDGGRLIIEVPCESAQTAWQDPTHVRAFNRKSWIYYTDWFWYLGWFDWNFHLQSLDWLDVNRRPCEETGAAFMLVRFVKTRTTPVQRTLARAMRADFGGVESDDLATF